MTENNQPTHFSDHDDVGEENAIKRLTNTMNDAQKEKFKELLGESLGGFVRQQADIARQIIYDDEQIPLESEYQQKLAEVPRGNIGAVTRLQTEMSKKGWRSAQLQADREPSPPTQAESLEKNYLLQQYQKEVAQHRGNLRRVSKIQAKYRAQGLDL